jgi:hypothetical protein
LVRKSTYGEGVVLTCPPWSGSAAAQAIGEVRAEFLAPASRGFVGDGNAACSQNHLDVTKADTERVVEPDGMADDLGMEPATINGGPGGAATMAPVPSNVMLSMVLPKSLLFRNDFADRCTLPGGVSCFISLLVANS